MKRIFQNLAFVLTIIFTLVLSAVSSLAAGRSAKSSSDYSSISSGGSMLIDVGALYTRDTHPEGRSDMATRLSLGGMFSSIIGLDLHAMYELHSKGYLVGTDLRLAPVSWFYIKAGGGLYGQKQKKELHLVPVAGMGILAPLAEPVYLTTELSYFQVTGRNHINFGGGIGLRF